MAYSKWCTCVHVHVCVCVCVCFEASVCVYMCVRRCVCVCVGGGVGRREGVCVNVCECVYEYRKFDTQKTKADTCANLTLHYEPVFSVQKRSDKTTLVQAMGTFSQY